MNKKFELQNVFIQFHSIIKNMNSFKKIVVFLYAKVVCIKTGLVNKLCCKTTNTFNVLKEIRFKIVFLRNFILEI